MTEHAIVLNAGSSSVKFGVYSREENGAWVIAARAAVTGIGTSPKLMIRDADSAVIAEREFTPAALNSAAAAVDVLAEWMRQRYGTPALAGVGHRVVHGGASYASPVVVDREVIENLRALIPLAPLHQPHNLAAIEAIAERRPDVPQVACFDTSFHSGQPAVARLVPLPESIRATGVQRYGFHGLSYEYIASVLPEAAPEIAEGRVIVAHLGSGASLCAMKAGASIDCTLGFTALDGLCMGTRPGSTDPGVMLHLFQTLGMTPAEVETILYKKSGLLGISGISNDMRDLETNADPRARLAVDYFVYQAAKQMGAMAAALGGVDGIVFTAGIGENSPVIRRRICEASAWLGVELDADANERHALRISKPTSRVPVCVIPTNEELMIARHTGRLLGLMTAETAGAGQRTAS